MRVVSATDLLYLHGNMEGQIATLEIVLIIEFYFKSTVVTIA